MYLSDPAPPASGPRSVFSNLARITTIQTTSGLRFLATFPGSGLVPPQGSACTDPATGCWITDTLSAVDPDRTTPQTIRLLANTVSAFGVNGTTGITQGDTTVLSAARGGAPYTQDADGDAVTVSWASTACPWTGGCGATQTGTSSTWTFPAPGAYSFAVTATDAFGATTTRTVDVTVANQAPVVALDSDHLAGTVSAPVELTGTIVDGGNREYRELHIDWGDGSTQNEYDGPVSFRYRHSYAARGSYTVTVTARDLTTDSASQQATVEIGNSAPTMTLLPASKSPSSWAVLQPGTAISIDGTASDQDTDRPLKVRVTWYDGETEELVVPRDPGQTTGRFTLRHTVGRTTNGGLVLPGGLPRLATVMAVDDDGATSTAYLLEGRVPDLQVVLSNLGWTAGTDTQKSYVIGKISDPNGRRDFVQLKADWGDGSPPEVIYVDQFNNFVAEHQYASTGTFTVTLTGTDRSSGNVTQQITMVISQTTHILQSAAWVTPPVVGQPATLRVVTSSPVRGRVTGVWGFGEGADEINFAAGDHTYEVTRVFIGPGGSYIPGRLYVSRSDDSDYDEQVELGFEIAGNPAPSLALGRLAGDPGVPVTLPLTYADLGDDTNTVTVDWGDGSPTDTTTLSLANPDRSLAHTYAAEGVYDVSVEVVDLVGNTVDPTTKAVIGNPLPALGALTLHAGREGAPSTVTATAVDPVGGPARLRVDWGDGTTTTSDPFTDPGPVDASHTYADNGRYPVSVVALDAAGQESAARTGTVRVRNAAPSLTLSAPSTVREGHELTLAITVTDRGSLDTGTARVDWGDGTPATDLAWTAGERRLSATHTYADDDPTGTPADPATITVTATDDDAGSGTRTRGASIRNVVPEVTRNLRLKAAGPLVWRRGWAPTGSTVIAELAVTDDGLADTHAAQVDWGDGTTTPETVAGGYLNATHTYAAPGERRVSVVVTDDDGGVSRTVTRSITIADPVPRVERWAAQLRFRARAGGTDPDVATALRSAARLLVAPRGAGGDLRAALVAGDATSAVDLVDDALDALATATADGGSAVAARRAVDLAVVARALVVTAIAAAPPGPGPTDADAARALADRAFQSGDLPTTLAQLALAMELLEPPPAP